MKKALAYAVGTLLALTLVAPAYAWPLNVYQDGQNPIQDNVPVPTNNVHELGFISPFGPFPTNEGISAFEMVWQGHIPCPTDYQGGGAVQIRMLNLTTIDWGNVWYVADPETSLSNWDELVGQVGFSPWLAFKIDAIGVNTPLIFESINPDGIFQAGETWEFVIQEYVNSLGAPPSAFDSLGIAAASLGWPPSSGSIIAVPVPEPSTLALAGCGAAMLLAFRSRRK
jgi:hypothetical protein